MTLCLSRDELIELTGKRTGPAQVRALRAMGIEHRVRPDGTPAVLTSEMLQTRGAVLQCPSQPDWETP